MMRLMTCSEASKELGVSRERIKRGVDAKRYPYVLLPQGRILVDLDELSPIINFEDALKNYIGIVELSKETGLSREVLRRGAEEGWIPSVKMGIRYRFSLDEVMAAIDGMRQRGSLEELMDKAQKHDSA